MRGTLRRSPIAAFMYTFAPQHDHAHDAESDERSPGADERRSGGDEW
jgi:hypothetical protein